MLGRAIEAQGVCVKASNTWLKVLKSLVSLVLLETLDGSFSETLLGQMRLSAWCLRVHSSA